MMTSYSVGDVVLLLFPFSDGRGAKRRPALMLVDVGDDDIVVARITSQDWHTVYDVPLQAWQSAGLRLPSVMRAHKLATLDKSLVEKRIG